MTSEIGLSLLVTTIGVVFLVGTFSIRGSDQGTRMLPTVYAIVILGGGLIRLLSSVKKATTGEAATAAPMVAIQSEGAPTGETAGSESFDEVDGSGFTGRAARVPRPLQVLVVMVAYVLLLRPLGYLISTALFGVALYLAIGRRFTPRLLVFPVVMTLVLYALFEFVLSVRLP